MSTHAQIGTLLGLSAINTTLGLQASKRQEKLDIATTSLETEVAKNQAAQQAYASAQGFREALASQLALSSLRGDGGSMVRQFASKSISNMVGDAQTFDQQQQFADLSGVIRKSQAKTDRFARDFSSVTSLLSSGVQAVTLGRGGKS